MFDNVCKFLAESFSADFASWLLGESISLTELSPSELSLEPIRADTLILLQSPEIVLHLEFQTQPDEDMAFRMIDYRLRVYRRFPHKRMRQVVIYLKKTNSELVYQNAFSIPGTRHEFEVIRLWEQPSDIFFRYPGLLPFAVLGETNDRAETLRQVAQEIPDIAERRTQSNVAAATSILAGLVLDKGLIKRLLRRELMQESVIYQELIEEGEAKGEAKGLAKGLSQGIQLVAANLIKNGMAVEEIAKVTGLTVEQVQLLRQQQET